MSTNSAGGMRLRPTAAGASPKLRLTSFILRGNLDLPPSDLSHLESLGTSPFPRLWARKVAPPPLDDRPPPPLDDHPALVAAA